MSSEATGEHGRRESLNRDRVLCAAVEIADERGLDALTMRELGRALGVEAASLYNHIDGKDDVLDGITDLAVAEIDVPRQGGDWKASMRRRAHSARDVFSRHPWAAALIDSPERMSPAQLMYADRVLGMLIEAGFAPRRAADAFLIVDSFVYGFERQRSRLSLGDEAENAEAAAEVVAAIEPDAFPALVQVAAGFAESPPDDATVFELGLEMILDGLDRLLAE